MYGIVYNYTWLDRLCRWAAEKLNDFVDNRVDAGFEEAERRAFERKL